MTRYRCPKCKMEYNTPGKCDMCKVTLEKIEEKETHIHNMHHEKHEPQEHNHKSQKDESHQEHEKHIPSDHEEHKEHTNHDHDEYPEHKEHIHHDHADHHQQMVGDFKKRFIISVLVTIPILLLSPLIQQLFNFRLGFPGEKYVLFVLSSFIFFYGGQPFLKGFFDESKKKQPGMMTLIALATSVAYFYSSAVVFGLKGEFFFWELATLIDVMLLGHWFEMKSVLGASKALEKLAQLMPDTAHLIKGSEVKEVKISALKKGDKILIKAGEKIPADGLVVKGSSYIDESMLTGESKPVHKKLEDKVIGGSVNGDAVLEVKVEGTGEESYLNKVINLVKEAQSSKSKTQKFADKAANWLTIIAVTTGAATLIYWFIYGPDLAFAIERMATVMVIACPHALGLAIPLVTAVSTTLSAKNGLLIRNRTAFENSRKITTVVFDKTGTLTEGKFGVSLVTVTDKSYDEKKIIQLAASLEKNSEHPIAKGIISRAEELKVKTLPVSDFEVIKGQGVKGKIEEKNIALVSQSYVRENNFEILKEIKVDETGTLVYVLLDNRIIGVIILADNIREESYEAIQQLKKLGIKCWMLTGDNKRIAEEVSNKLYLDGYFAEVLPHEKLEKIKELQNNGEFVAMTGDGINDAPALAQADVGIAIGSGTDVAAETADIILVNSNPLDVSSLILFGRATYSKMIQNLFWATGYNVIAIPLAAGALYNYGILISPAIGAAFMSLSTIIVAINAQFLSIRKETSIT
ncbi:MAG: copper-translocating P-type ATPase [Candidatus Infernicultor aquiphilus]|uniref:Copper-translocating P-type ATPase n=4 Tax=Candidatus Infernicultor aquiphilus TaxID=1805029 RepID=A0A2M7KB38_9BACT|nr:MAG: copper-translocating P-type ATPase [Candidatus Atribacteria bacterium CG08_land_8_20_14_0_20_33_29]PIW12628.1 MAG: copper-translocating P-type ATPase [Candidatus Atribacteria bacterium CG17_big_fil_post_rev_8_21_14_2_50_34_11]PIX35350.1 MAG: copper-translocating P-type ATPase [Candidatus Atribacteria bacterium CG_4_8_14_3_um_filter_34_18]